jgi:hypothetical protein
MSVARAEDRAPWRHDPSADPGAKTEGGRHDAALSFPFGIGTKAAKRPNLFQCALYLISRPRSLHFTLNHHNSLPRTLDQSASGQDFRHPAIPGVLPIEDVLQRDAVRETAGAVDLQASGKLPDEVAARKLVVPMADRIQDRLTHRSLVERGDRRHE